MTYADFHITINIIIHFISLFIIKIVFALCTN